MSRKKKIIGGLISAVVVCLIYTTLTMYYIGNIDYAQAFETAYDKTDSSIRITKTNWAQLQTTSRFLNIPNKPTCPGYVGVFLTSKGMLHYEYGMFSPTFDSEYAYAQEYEIDTDSLNGRLITTVETETEFGISMPAQQDMKWTLVIYPSTTAKKLKEELINLFATAEFK